MVRNRGYPPRGGSQKRAPEEVEKEPKKMKSVSTFLLLTFSCEGQARSMPQALFVSRLSQAEANISFQMMPIS